MTTRRQFLRILFPGCLIVAGVMGFNSRSFGQDKPAKVSESFQTKMTTQREYYEAPDEDKVKMEITGDTTSLTNGFLVTNAEIKSFAVTGGPPQMTAQTPDCFINTSITPWELSSTNVLQARSGDGNFFVEGVGFRWQNAQSELVLSNRVHTIIRQLAMAAGTPVKTNAAPSPTDIYSEHGTFKTKEGLIVYRDDVRVINPQLHLTSAILTVQLAQGGTNNQLDHIVAETNVVMDFTDEYGRKTHATGDKAVYRRMVEPATNDFLTLTGNPRLETTNGWATADVFVMNQTTGKIQGSGHCYFHSASEVGAVASSTNKPAAPTVITADNFDYDTKTGLTIFRDNVHVDNPQMKLVCDKMTATLHQGDISTNGFDNIVADGSVAIDYLDEQGEKTHATAEKAVYNSSIANGVTNKVLDLTGNPVLERTNGWIMADLITMDQGNSTIRAEGNHHTIFKRAPGRISKDAPPAASDTEIFSDHFDYNRATGMAFYSGNVRVLDPGMHLQCLQITVKLPEGAETTNRGALPDRIVAETNVIVDYFSEKGEKTHATGDKMVFTQTVTSGNITNKVLELTGNPIIDMTDLKGQTTHATGDRATYNSTAAPGKVIEVMTLSGHPKIRRTDGIVATSDEVITYDRTTGVVHGVGPQNHISITVRPSPGKTNHPAALSGGPLP